MHNRHRCGICFLGRAICNNQQLLRRTLVLQANGRHGPKNVLFICMILFLCNGMGKLLYIIFLSLYTLGARIAALFSAKARLWLNGRRNIFDQLRNGLSAEGRKRIWVHCSSLGEFEQGLPVIEALRKTYPGHCIVLTFFSPSGYEHEKNNSNADHIFYMPLDGAVHAKRLYETVQPSLVIFIKYEFWYYYLEAAASRNIPLLLVSGVFRKSQPFFQWYGSFHRSMLKLFTHLFVQQEAALSLMHSIGIYNSSVSGDTRFDRVLEIADKPAAFPSVAAFCADYPVIVAGSTWLEDDEILAHYVNTHTDYRFIIAPHDIGNDRVKSCLQLYKKSMRYSVYNEKGLSVPGCNTLIIDNIGMLKYLYRYGSVCFVGGGFGGDGVHNVLEAAVYHKPVVFGPVYDKFPEATALIQYNGAYTVEDALELEQVFDELLEDADLYATTCANAGRFIKERTGATQRVMQYIQEKRLLTS